MKSELPDRIDAQAGDWLARRDSEPWSAADQLDLDRWLAESYRHRVAYLRLEHVWEESRRLRALAAGARSDIPPPGTSSLSPFFEPSVRAAEQPAPSVSTANAWGRRRKFGLAALAASALVALAAGTLWYVFPAGTTYRTPVGGLESVPMPDGSKVTLNTDTEIRVAVTATERSVRLDKGEAFFEVAKDPERPFVVTAGNKRVVAVGTKFSVYREGSDIRVVVQEGTVRLEPASARARSAGERAQPEPLFSSTAEVASSGSVRIVPSDSSVGHPPGSADVVLLPAGSVARASDAGVLVQQEPMAQAEEALSWRAGVLVFRDATLAEAIAEFNRYNERQVVIEDPGIAALRIAGTFRATNAEGFVRLLEQGYPIAVDEGENGVVLRRR